MEESLLIDAAERYFRGEMNAEEKAYFDQLRKNNPDVDRTVLEYLHFLADLEKIGDQHQLTSKMAEARRRMMAEGLLQPRQGKLVSLGQLWTRYKRTISVAASIAVIVSALCASLISAFSTKKQTNIRPLVEKIREQDAKYRRLENKLGEIDEKQNATPSAETHFRATGFLIDPVNQYLVTNAHVAREAKHRVIVENQKGEQFSAEVAYINTDNDLALLRITDPEFRRLPALPYSIRKSENELGDQVYMLGYPKQEIVYTEGYVSARNGYGMDTIFCQLNTQALEGNSGSPVINTYGEVVGIVSSKENNAEGVVYAIKSSNLYHCLNEMKKVQETAEIQIVSKPSLRKYDRITQIKKVQDYVFMVKGN